jgi:hypothetical protein
MKELLEQDNVSLRLGPASVQEAKEEIAAIEGWVGADVG